MFIASTELRTRFAAALSDLYGREVPAYKTLVEVSREVNERYLDSAGVDGERFGSIERVTSERHGAIRVGTPQELAQLARIFGAFGMYATGFYDLRDAAPRPIPVVATAFRPQRLDELARNPFRVFTSLLVPEDRRFFDVDLEARLRRFLDSRELFSPELLGLSDRAVADGGLKDKDAEIFIALAIAAFALSSEPVDRAWYSELDAISSVAADIGGVRSTHINHLTPRVLDIDDLYASMTSRGVEMIDRIQGPPRWHGPDVLLRQTSFRAQTEPRAFRKSDGSIRQGKLRVRFGEVESRGIALTASGRDLYDSMIAAIDASMEAHPCLSREQVAESVWSTTLPATEEGLRRRGLAFFTYHLTHRPAIAGLTLDRMVADGDVEARPIVYEDFLPRSAAGIFASNLSGETVVDADRDGAHRNIGWLSDVIGQRILAPEEIYQTDSDASLDELESSLGFKVAV